VTEKLFLNKITKPATGLHNSKR